jgi:hypothetical protein
MKGLQIIAFLLSITASTAFSQIRHIPIAPAKQVPELTGTWVPDEKQNKKLLKKAAAEMRKKMTSRMPKPPEGGGPPGGGMPGGGGPPGGGGMPGGGGPPGGGGMPGGPPPGGGSMPEMPRLEEIASMQRVEMDFALPVRAPLQMKLEQTSMVFVSRSGERISIPLSGKPQVLAEGLRGYGMFTSSGYTIEFNTDDKVRVAYTYWIEENDILKVRTEIYNPMVPMPLTFDRVFRRQPRQ